MAPGKLVLTGAYAVLRGAPAVVVAVDRYAVADPARSHAVDVRRLHDASGRKLGLGSSAASMVAAEGARVASSGRDVRDGGVRATIFDAVREAHARAQGGGSGVDVAAAVHGGALLYRLDGSRASIEAVELPRGVTFAAFWSGSSARTSDLRALVDGLPAVAAEPVFEALGAASEAAAAAVAEQDRDAFVRAARAFGLGLQRLGRVANAPIVPPAFGELAALADHEGAAFYPSGAGGGDVGVWLGSVAPSAAFLARAEALAMRPLDLRVDQGGVRPESTFA